MQRSKYCEAIKWNDITHYNTGKSQAEIANLLKVSNTMVSKWINLYKDPLILEEHLVKHQFVMIEISRK